MDKSNYLKPREYEMLAVLLPDQGDEETQTAIDKMLGYITDENGTIDSVNADSPWGRRRLAYTIRHEGVDYRDGHYVLVYFTVLPSAITEIERELKLDTNVIRYLMLIHDPEMGEKFDESAIDEDAEEADETAATDDAPAGEDAPADEAAADEATKDEATAEDAAEEDAPAEDTAEEDAPAEEETASEVAAEDAPAEDNAETEEEAPAEEAEESDKE